MAGTMQHLTCISEARRGTTNTMDTWHYLFCWSTIQSSPPIRTLSCLLENPAVCSSEERLLSSELSLMHAPTTRVVLVGMTQESRDLAEMTMVAES